jgi:hypothetical protein
MKTLLSFLFLFFIAQANSAIRVIPCKSEDCENQQATHRVSLSVASKLSDGRHQIYFYNIETKQSFFYSVNKFYEPEMRRMFIRARGPSLSTVSMGQYISDVYELESSPYTAIGIDGPGEGSVRLGTGTYHGVSVINYPLLWEWPLTISSLGGQPFGSSAWGSGITSSYFSHLLYAAQQQNPNLTSNGLRDALNASMGRVANGNISGESIGYGSSSSVNIGAAGTTVEARVERMDGSSSTFTFNVLAPSTAIFYPDGLIVMSWNPESGSFEITHVIDADGNVIEFTDGKLAVDTSQTYKITSVSAEIWTAIIEAMGIRNAGDMALFNKLKNMKDGYVRICGGVGFPPCPAP